MTEELKDRSNLSLENGFYLGVFEEDCYEVFRRDGKWMATDGRREYELGFPKGLPDSSIMPEGQVDASSLVRLPDKDIGEKVMGLSEEIVTTKKALEGYERRFKLLASHKPQKPQGSESPERDSK